MRGHRRSSGALALAIAGALSTSVTMTNPARASVGPGCEAGAPCADSDGDGFVACACAPAGTPCDCDDADPLTFPGAPEACDSIKDRDCDKVAGYKCGEGKGCLRGACVAECIPLDDFGCGIGNHCEGQPNGQRLCAGPDCSDFGCPPGQTCDEAKVCLANCNATVKCPSGQRCRGLGCVDPCDGVACGAGSICNGGACGPSCDCFPESTGCAPGQACDRTAAVPRCIDQACVGIRCPDGSHCAAGNCVDDCAGVVCPPKRVCQHVANDGGATRGTCVDLCAPNPCVLPMTCDFRTGLCLAAMFPEAGLQPVTPEAGIDDGLFAAGAGLMCTTTGIARASATGVLAAALAFGVLLARRARRRRRGR